MGNVLIIGEGSKQIDDLLKHISVVYLLSQETTAE